MQRITSQEFKTIRLTRIKDMAYVITTSNYDKEKGYQVGIVIRNMKGIFLTDWFWGKDFEKAQDMADERNIKIHSSLDAVDKLILSTM